MQSWRVRYQNFTGRYCAVFHPAGRALGGVGARPKDAPPPFKPPKDVTVDFARRDHAEKFARELRGENTAVTIEPINPPSPPPRPVQLDLLPDAPRMTPADDQGTLMIMPVKITPGAKAKP